MGDTAPHSVTDSERRAHALLETFDAWADVLRSGPEQHAVAAGPTPAPGPATRSGATAPAEGAVPVPRPVDLAGRVGIDATPLTRPVLRAPMALLHVIDDGRETGETVRMRGDRLVIGRHEGDVVVPHDLLMSPRHAAIERMPDGQWQLVDLGSGGGTFVRVTQARLRDGGELVIGSTRLVLREVDLTEAWLVERSPRDVAAGLPPDGGRRHECHAPATTIGRTGHGCTIQLDDRFVSPIHAELVRSARGWKIRNAGVNGVWVRIGDPVRLGEPSQFQCGEQRFVFEALR